MQIYTITKGKYKGRKGFIAYEYAGNKVAFRFGTPSGWLGETTLDRSILSPI